jgi:adenylate cyclase
MTADWEIRVYENQSLVFSETLSGSAELGRQNKGEDGPYRTIPQSGLARIVLARLEEDAVSRRHVLIEPLDQGRFRLTNLSTRQAIRLADGSRLEPADCCEVIPPVLFSLGTRTVRLQEQSKEEEEFQSLAEATVTPGREDLLSRRYSASVRDDSGYMEPEKLVRWIQNALGVLHSAAGSLDFFARAAHAVVELAGLDSGRVLLREGGDWKVRAHETATRSASESDWLPSRQVLTRVLEEKRTFWQVPAAAQRDASLMGVKAVVAAPILNPKGEVIGALYGYRRHQPGDLTARPISRLEAMLVEVLAGGVAAGLARVEQEQAALRARVQFEQFFTPELSRHLTARPDLLQSRDTHVTVLFSDIRNFSRVSERLGPARILEWIGDVLGALSDCVLDEGGVLVDYVGDELMAMWGAPEDQPDHARRAARAALAMLARLPDLNARWQPVLQAPTEIGIGINTGIARVGNVGSKRKFKYGALGNTVNLASRVQGATKYLKTPVLITQATQEQLGAEIATRRLCRVRVQNIVEPVTLYEATATDHPGWSALKADYEDALEKFDKQEFHLAAHLLAMLLLAHPHDNPALQLMGRAVRCLVEEPDTFDPVWELPGK